MFYCIIQIHWLKYILTGTKGKAQACLCLCVCGCACKSWALFPVSNSLPNETESHYSHVI